MRRRAHGFTLPELMVAVALLGILSVLAWRGIDGMQMALRRTEAGAARWQAVARALDKLVVDLRQVTREPLPLDTKPRAAWAGVAAPAGDHMEFMRAPLVAGQPLRRIGYRLHEGRLELLLWPDASAADAPPRAETLLEAVSGFEVRYLGGDLRWHERWPQAQLEAAPRAVRVRIALAEGEHIERVVALP